MPLWEFQFSRETESGYNYDSLEAKLVSITREKRHEEATIRLKRSRYTEDLVEQLPIVVCFFDGNYVWAGKLLSYTKTRTYITAVLYNGAFEACKGKTATGKYANASAATVLSDICAAAGVGFDGCPSTEVSVRFDEADCWNAILFLADATGTEPYGYAYENGDFYLGLQVPNQNWYWLPNAKPKSLGEDYTQYRNKVRVRGVDANGLKIVGEAGEGDKVAVFNEKKATDQATLAAIAQRKLEELQDTLSTIPLTCPMLPSDRPWEVQPGYMVGFDSQVFRWGGYYKCQKMTVYPTKVDFELVKPKKTLDQMVADLKKYADLGIYSIEPDQLTPMALNTQGLFGLYHLNEGDGETAKDSSPNNEETNDGTITNGFWVQGPVTKFLNFDAAGHVDCGAEFDVGGLEKFAVGIWASPEAAFDDGNYMIYKDGQFRLQLYSMANLGRFGVRIGGQWYDVVTDQAVVDLYGRLFIMGVKTEDAVQIYVNGKFAKQEPLSGAVDASGAHVYLGWNGAAGYFHGGLAEAMLWGRKLAAQEVQELYFFPLTRIVRRGESVPPWPFPLKSLNVKVLDLNEDFNKTRLSVKVLDVGSNQGFYGMKASFKVIDTSGQ